MCFVFYHTHKRTPCLETSSDAALSGIPQAVAFSQVPGDLFSKFLLEKECKTELPGHFKSWNDGRETISTSRSQAWRHRELYLQVKTWQHRVHTSQVCQEEAAPGRAQPFKEGHTLSKAGHHATGCGVTWKHRVRSGGQLEKPPQHWKGNMSRWDSERKPEFLGMILPYWMELKSPTRATHYFKTSTPRNDLIFDPEEGQSWSIKVEPTDALWVF